ncbi:hypothetical protein D3C76_944080 [compost metagenome]
MQHAHAADVWHLAQRIASQIHGFEQDEVAQLVCGLHSQFDLIVAQVQLGQSAHPADRGWQPGQRIVVHVQGSQPREMLEKRSIGISHFGIRQLQLGDMLEIGFKLGHCFQVPPHGDVAEVKDPTSRVSMDIEVAGTAALPAVSDGPVHTITRLPLCNAIRTQAERVEW